ncbi:MAG: putative acetyltransferase [Bacteroidetes bacterium ADurb.Bin174]|nr:MAG: putative acetyltransferase [Bacteroidetes bacterium ADurb.Bin174]
MFGLMKMIKSAILFFYNLMHIVKRSFWTAFIKITCKKYGKRLTVNAKSSIGRNVTIGENCHFNGMNISEGGEVYIGDNFHSATKCEIIVQFHNYDTGVSIPYDHSVVCKSVIIEANVWLGYHVIILGNVHIGEGAIIQAGSVVVNNIPKCSIAGGNPARVFKMRDVMHYEKLKVSGKFN